MSNRNRNWIQRAKNKMEQKGTKGAFTDWCKGKGYNGVTDKCIEEGLQSSNATTKARAQFAKNVQKKREGGAVLQSILKNAGAKEGQGLKSLIEDKGMELRGQFGEGKFKDALKGQFKDLKSQFKPSMGQVVNVASQLLAKRAENKAGKVAMADPYRDNIMERKATKRAAFGAGFKAAADGKVGQALGKIPVFGKVLQAGAGLVGGLIGGRKAVKQKERDRKEAVKQLRLSQNAQLQQQNAEAAQFETSGESGFADVGASITNSYLAQRARLGGVKRYSGGGEMYEAGGVYQGKKLPGGRTEPLPGGALEFIGKKHSQGGIMLDPQTEVEGGETMDKVQMKKTGGTMQDYIFSDHLKLGGKTFATRHKELLQGGAKQKDIQELARLQEKKAGRTPKVMQFGGATQYQRMDNGGIHREATTSAAHAAAVEENLQTDSSTGVDASEIMVDGKVWSEENTQAKSKGLYGEQTMDDVAANLARNEWFNTKDERFGPDGFDPTKPADVKIFQEEYNKRAAKSNKPQLKVDGKWGKQTSTATIPWNAPMTPRKPVLTVDYDRPEPEIIVPPEKIDPPGGDIPPPKTPPIETPPVPTAAFLGAGAQLIPPLYALKNPPAYVSGPGAASVQAPSLPRVNFNAERSANANDFRTVSASIENTGGGPASVVNLLAALDKKQTADREIAKEESRANKELSAEEARMTLTARKATAELGLDASQFATKIALDQINNRREEKLSALDSLSERLAGMSRDKMEYAATERLAKAIGRDGVYERENLYNYYIGKGMSPEEALKLAAASYSKSNEAEEEQVAEEQGTKKKGKKKSKEEQPNPKTFQSTPLQRARRGGTRRKRGSIFTKLDRYKRR